MQFLAGNAVALLENGEQYFPAPEAAFDGAAHEVFLQRYIFDDVLTGRRLAVAEDRLVAPVGSPSRKGPAAAPAGLLSKLKNSLGRMFTPASAI